MSETLVADVMTKEVACFRPDDSVGQADAGMQLARIRHLPVLDKAGKLVGILSNRDVIRGLRAGVHKPVMVQEVMTEKPLTVRPDATAAEAAQLLLDEKVGALPVLDADGKLVGIVTESDFVAVALRLLRGEPARRPTP